MGVRIRLARMGKVRQPFYNITVSDSKRGVRKLPIEVIGTYDATTKALPGTNQKYKEIQLDFDRAKYWLGVGALPSDTVASIFRKVDILPPTEKELERRKLAGESVVEEAAAVENSEEQPEEQSEEQPEEQPEKLE